MINMAIVFYMFLAIFALIGWMRGWAKELLVVFSVILALAFIVVMETFIPVVNVWLASNKLIQYSFRVISVILLVMAGYQSPKLKRLAPSAERRDRVQDFLLGPLLGLLSGYMVIGTLWFFAHQAGYIPFEEYVTQPDLSIPGGEKVLRLLQGLPPVFLMKPATVFIAVVICFILVIVLFV